MVIESAIGGANVTTTIEGRERFPVNVRYQRALPQRHRRAQADADRHAGRRADSDRAGGGHLASARARRHPHRAGPAARLRLRGRGRSGHRRLRAGRQARGGGDGDSCPRATPSNGAASTSTWSARPSALRIVIPADAAHRDRAALLQHPKRGKDSHRASRRAVLPHRRVLADLPARLQHERRRVGGDHRARRRGCGNRSGDAALPRSGIREVQGRGPHEHDWPTCRRRSRKER